MPQVNDLVLNNNHSLTCMRQLYLIMPQVNDLVLNNNHSLTCMRQLYLIMPQVNDLSVKEQSLTHLYEAVVSDNASS